MVTKKKDISNTVIAVVLVIVVLVGVVGTWLVVDRGEINAKVFFKGINTKGNLGLNVVDSMAQTSQVSTGQGNIGLKIVK